MPLKTVEGLRFPGGRYRITAAENAALCEAIGAQSFDDGRAHPIFYYIAGQVGMGMSVGELLALCDFDVADGPMMVSSAVAFEQDLRVEEDYEVSGEIASLVRRPSRTFGAVDHLAFSLTLALDGRPVARMDSGWVLPRREEHAA